MFGAFLRRLRGLSLVNRWNFHYVNKPENVAEHSYWVAIYAMVLADMENKELTSAAKYNVQEVMRGALLHDWEEAVTGDLPSLVKKTCKSDWAKVENAGFDQLVEPLNGTGADAYYKSFWHTAHDYGDRVGMLIKAADLMDRLAYAYDEQQRGNKAFDRIVLETVKQLRAMRLLSVDSILVNWGYTAPGVELPEVMTHL